MKNQPPKTIRPKKKPFAYGRELMFATAFLALLISMRQILNPPSDDRFYLHRQEAFAEMERAIKVCQDKFVYEKLTTNQQMADCATPGIVDAFRSAGFPDMALIRAFTQERVELAKKLDKRELTRPEAQAKEEEFLTRLQEEAEGRRAAEGQ